VLLNAVNLFLQVFFTIMYSDLECDYINPIDLCNRLNMYIVPEAGVHAFLTVLFLINGYWLPLLLNLPLVAWNGKKYVLPYYARIWLSHLWLAMLARQMRNGDDMLT
jgi:protein cornichon